MILLVKLGDPGRGRKQWISYLPFVVLTVGPWVLMVWLLWPRR